MKPLNQGFSHNQKKIKNQKTARQEEEEEEERDDAVVLTVPSVPLGLCSFMFLPHFDDVCHLLCRRHVGHC